MKFCEFPKGFVWGTATASYQVEGAASEDGRTPSVWDTFSHTPGKVAEGHTGDVACDHYHRYKEDVALMKSMGLKAYRFSVSWSRIFPDPTRSPNPKGLDFYKRLIDELRSADIEPWMTCFHWDTPQWAEDRYGGWRSKQITDDFAHYTGYLARELGDRVNGIFTINEFLCFIDLGYGPAPTFAPGVVTTQKVLNQARHHAVLAHGLAVQAIRAECRGNCPPVGLAENIPNVVPLLETPQDIAAAKEALRELSGMYLTPILEGRYHPNYLASPDAPQFTDDEMKAISTPIDFVGMNLYAPTYVRADARDSKGWAVVPCDADYPKMHMPWLNIGPAITYWAPRLVHEIWKVPSLYITENGCAYPDVPTSDNEILDSARMMYLQNHFIHAHRAVAEGVPLKGYFVWSLMDNFEWAMGYTKRFGIHYMNYETMERTRKLSADFYALVIARNAVGG